MSVDRDAQIEVLADFAEAVALLKVCKDSVEKLERKVYMMFGLEPGPQPTGSSMRRSLSSERDQRSFAAKRQRIDSCETLKLGETNNLAEVPIPDTVPY